MVIMYNGRVTDGDRVTLQWLWQCNVVYSNKLDSIVVPNIVTVHKRVEVRMEDTNRKPPHKFTDLGREFMMLADPTPSNSGAVVYAFDAIIPILMGPNSRGATLTYRRDNAYANVLVKRSSKRCSMVLRILAPSARVQSGDGSVPDGKFFH
jgi:hypothetical protein